MATPLTVPAGITRDPCLTLRGHSAHIVSLAASQNGRLLASVARDRTVRIWDLQTGKQCALREWCRCAPWGFHRAAAFSVDANRVYIADGRGKVHVLQRSATLATEDLIDPCGSSWLTEFMTVTNRFTLSVIDESGCFAISCPDGTVRLCRPECPDEPQIVFTDSRRRVPVFASARTLCATVIRNDLVVYDLRSGCELRSYTLTKLQKPDRMTAMTIAHDARTVAIGYASGRCEMRSVDDCRIIRQYQSSGVMVQDMAISADGSYIAGIASDGNLCVWDTAIGKRRLLVSLNGGRMLPMPSPSVCFPTCERVAATCNDHQIRVWPLG